MEPDRRTTPRWLQTPMLMVLGLLIIYFLSCFHFAMGTNMPTWAWFGHWDMFTKPGRFHHAVEAEAYYDGSWHAVDLTELFPYEWGSGPRYARRAFRRNPGRVRVLAASTCVRHPGDVERVRMTEVSWRKTVGSYEQPRERGVKQRKMIDFRCGSPVALPGGRTL